MRELADRRIVGSRLKTRREAHGLSQEQLAWAVGYKRHTSILAMEHERPDSNPPAEKIQAIASLLDVPIGWLFGEGPDQPVSLTDTHYARDGNAKDGTAAAEEAWRLDVPIITVDDFLEAQGSLDQHVGPDSSKLQMQLPVAQGDLVAAGEWIVFDTAAPSPGSGIVVAELDGRVVVRRRLIGRASKVYRVVQIRRDV